MDGHAKTGDIRLKVPTSKVDTVALNLLPPTHFEGEDEVEPVTSIHFNNQDLFSILGATDVNLELLPEIMFN